MKLSSIRIDSARLEGGDWVENIPGLEDVRLRVRGIDNLDYRRLHGTLIDGVGKDEREENGRILPKVPDDIMVELLFKTVLLDWQNVEAEESTPEIPVMEPYTHETGFRYLTDPDYRAFREGVAGAATQVAKRSAAKREADAGN